MKKDNKKVLYEAIMTSVAKEVKKVLNESIDDWNEDDEYEQENNEEIITYNDIIDAVEGHNYQEIIDDNGESVGDWILDRILYPENGANVYDACVEIAQRLLDGEDPDDLREELGDTEI